MKLLKKISYLLYICVLSCNSQSKNNNTSLTSKEVKSEEPVQTEIINGLKKAYFASGCFWCVEAIYESVKGVDEVISGYSGGHTENPTYESSNTGRTGHAEAVEVYYDPKVISFEELVDVYFGSQNITQVNGQGPDRGSQYRSIIFYQNDEELDMITSKKEAIEDRMNIEVAAEIRPFQKFWKAEAYHQDYEKNHPGNPYIQNVSIPRLKKFQAKYPDLIKKEKKSISH